MKRIFALVSAVVLSGFLPGALAQSDPFVGKWKINAVASKTPGEDLTLTFEAQGNGVKFSSKGRAQEGNNVAYGYTATYDGKDSPISGTGVPSGADTIALTRINPNTVESIWKKAGKVVRRSQSAISNDGKILTITVKRTNAKGEPADLVLIWDKQ